MVPRRRKLIASVAGAAIVAGALAFVLLHSGGEPGDGGIFTTSPAPTASPTVAPATLGLPPAAPVAGLKPDISGLIDRKGPPPAEALGYVGGFVVNVNWSDLQSAPGAPIPQGNAIDQAIDTARRLNAQGGHLGVKIRIFAGLQTPQWLKDMDGGPVTVQDPQSLAVGTIGHFWLPDFGTYYAQFMQELAARYDAVPEVRDVTVSRCTTVFAEPFQRQISSHTTVSALLAAGFTATADVACETAQIDEAGAAWKHTHLSVSFNPYQQINGDGTTVVNESVTDDVMRYCRKQLKEQCTLENNSIRTPPLPGYLPMYAFMQRLGPPICFQTATAERVGDLAATVQWAMGEGAIAVELPEGYPRLLPQSTAASLQAALAARPQR